MSAPSERRARRCFESSRALASHVFSTKHKGATHARVVSERLVFSEETAQPSMSKKRRQKSLPPSAPPPAPPSDEALPWLSEADATDETAFEASPTVIVQQRVINVGAVVPPAPETHADLGEALAQFGEVDETRDATPPLEVASHAPDPEPLPSLPPEPPRNCRVLAVGGSKGGVGKSVFAANTAIYLASIGRRVLIVDADRGGANLHTLVGGPARGQVGRFPTAVPGLELLVTGVDGAPGAPRRTQRLTTLLAGLRQEALDYVVIDLGSLTSRTHIDAFLTADATAFITLPEPTALEGTYRFLARAFLRIVLRDLPRGDARTTLITCARKLGGAPAPLDLWRALDDDAHPVADLVRERMETFHPALVLNQTRLRADLELGDALKTVVRRRFGLTLEYLGHIEHDDTVWSAVRARKLLLIESPGTKAAKNVEKIARRILAIESGKLKPARRIVPAESHHDLLEVERGATEEEIRRAHKRVREIFSADALICYSLFTEPELAHVRTRIQEAFDVLLDPLRRRPYELSVFPDSLDHEVPRSTRELDDEPLPPAPEITPDSDFTGALLRAVRQSRGIRIEEISQKTKIGSNYLLAIENDDYAGLPAAVYVRGFVSELAKLLKLDATQVSRTYVRRYRRYLDERQGKAS